MIRTGIPPPELGRSVTLFSLPPQLSKQTRRTPLISALVRSRSPEVFGSGLAATERDKRVNYINKAA